MTKATESLRTFAPTPAPNAWWQEFDAALAHALDQGWSALKSEDYALEAAERAHPGEKHA